MSTNAIITSANLDVSKVSFGDIRANKAGGKSVPIRYNGQNLQIRIPKTSYPMGINIKDTDNGTTYGLSLTLKGCDPFAKDRAGAEAGELGSLYNFLLDMQEKLVQTAVISSKKWFGKDRTEAVIRDTMKQFLSPSVEKINGEWVPSGKYPPSLRMKVPVYDGRVSMDVVDSTGKPVEVDTENLSALFPKRVDASVVVAPSIYVTGTGFGVTWRVIYAKVSPPQRVTAADVFRDEIEEEMKVPVAPPTTPENEEEHEQTEISVPMSEETPTAPPVVVQPPPNKPANRRRAAAAV